MTMINGNENEAPIHDILLKKRTKHSLELRNAALAMKIGPSNSSTHIGYDRFHEVHGGKRQTYQELRDMADNFDAGGKTEAFTNPNLYTHPRRVSDNLLELMREFWNYERYPDHLFDPDTKEFVYDPISKREELKRYIKWETYEQAWVAFLNHDDFGGQILADVAKYAPNKFIPKNCKMFFTKPYPCPTWVEKYDGSETSNANKNLACGRINYRTTVAYLREHIPPELQTPFLKNLPYDYVDFLKMFMCTNPPQPPALSCQRDLCPKPKCKLGRLYDVDEKTGLVQFEILSGMVKRPEGVKLPRLFYQNEKTSTAKGNEFKYINRRDETLEIPSYWEKVAVDDVGSKIHVFADQWQSAVHHQIRQGGNHPNGSMMLTRDRSKAMDRRTSIHFTGREWIAPGEQMGLENVQALFENDSQELTEYPNL